MKRRQNGTRLLFAAQHACTSCICSISELISPACVRGQFIVKTTPCCQYSLSRHSCTIGYDAFDKSVLAIGSIKLAATVQGGYYVLVHIASNGSLRSCDQVASWASDKRLLGWIFVGRFMLCDAMST
jgi:hypothetical protein